MQRTTSYLCLRIDKSSEMTWREVENGKTTKARAEQEPDKMMTRLIKWRERFMRSGHSNTEREKLYTQLNALISFIIIIFGVGVGDGRRLETMRHRPTSTQYLLWNVWRLDVRCATQYLRTRHCQLWSNYIMHIQRNDPARNESDKYAAAYNKNKYFSFSFRPSPKHVLVHRVK